MRCFVPLSATILRHSTALFMSQRIHAIRLPYHQSNLAGPPCVVCNSRCVVQYVYRLTVPWPLSLKFHPLTIAAVSEPNRCHMHSVTCRLLFVVLKHRSRKSVRLVSYQGSAVLVTKSLLTYRTQEIFPLWSTVVALCIVWGSKTKTQEVYEALMQVRQCTKQVP